MKRPTKLVPLSKDEWDFESCCKSMPEEDVNHIFFYEYARQSNIVKDLVIRSLLSGYGEAGS